MPEKIGLQFAFLCESAKSAGGKIDALGIGFDSIQVPSVPSMYQNFTSVIRLRIEFEESESESGSFPISGRLFDVNSNRDVVKLQGDAGYETEGDPEGTVDLVLVMPAIQFPRFSKYRFDFSVDDRIQWSTEFDVVPEESSEKS